MHVQMIDFERVHVAGWSAQALGRNVTKTMYNY